MYGQTAHRTKKANTPPQPKSKTGTESLKLDQPTTAGPVCFP